MRTNRYELGFMLAVCVLAILALTCDDPYEAKCYGNPGKPDRSYDCNEFKVWSAEVETNGSPHAGSGWYPISGPGATLATDASGEAELNLRHCWRGRIYILKNSGGIFHTNQCGETEYNDYATTCISFGSWYVEKCADKLDFIRTGSAKIKKAGALFSVTYLPENRRTTLVVVLDGKVRVAPVNTFNPTELGAVASISGGQFYFTMPEAELSNVAGLEPRVAHPVDALATVADELGVKSWMFDVHDKAVKDGALPGNWPLELGGPGDG